MKNEIRQYRKSGADSIRESVPRLISIALSDLATEEEMYFVANVCLDLGQCDDSVAILKRLDARFGLGDIGWNNLGFAYDELNQQLDAFHAYRKSIFLNPGNISSLRAACYLAIETDHDRDALSLCEAFQTKTPDSTESAIWYSIALYNCDRKDELISFITKWQDLHGENAELQAIMEKDK